MTLLFTVIGYNIRIFLNDNERKLANDFFISILGNSLSFAYDFSEKSARNDPS